MKGFDLISASQASTATCSTVGHQSIVHHAKRSTGHRRGDYRKARKQMSIVSWLYYLKSRKSSARHSGIRRKSSADINNLTCYPDYSSRYLLSNSPFPFQSDNTKQLNSSDSHALKSSSSARSSEQVVVFTVSIHCKGCERKIRKQISKMEGVKSFSIDLASKKVTIKGNVTPLDVLTTVSKVKNAKFWPSSTSIS